MLTQEQELKQNETKLTKIIKALGNFVDKDIYIYTEPELFDFINIKKNIKITFANEKHKTTITLEGKIENVRESMAYLSSVINNDLQFTIIWNCKNLFSWNLNVLKTILKLSNFIDLKIIENYLGIEKPRPETYQEAKQRLKKCIENSSWKKVYQIYKKVYHPLITRVVPELEGMYLADLRTKHLVFCFYDVSGINARMKCCKVNEWSYNPHGLKDEDKEHLRLTDDSQLFLYFDYKHMEPSVLQWLSKDQKLKEILDRREDLYSSIWKIITKIDANEEYREKCKRVFLPVMYGLGIKTLSENNKVSNETANKLINNIRTNFAEADQWLKQQQSSLINDYYEDYFGRKKEYLDEFYKIRGTSVQSPSALICLHKLIKLSDLAKAHKSSVVFHVHDGYMCSVNHQVWRAFAKKAKELLESEEDLYPELKLSVTVKVGKRMNDLKLTEV